MGGLALVRITDGFMDVAFVRAGDEPGDVTFTHAFAKRLQG
jgi:cytolysin (calcineurin-like family phosphatase)